MLNRELLMPKPHTFIPRDNPRRQTLTTIAAGGVVLGALFLFEYLGNRVEPSHAENPVEANITIKPVDSVFELRRQTDPTYPLPGFIAEQLPHGNYQRKHNVLIQQAAQAVREEDRLALAQGLALMGANSLSENDLASSRVYLEEALGVYEEAEDSIGIASVELLRSRVESVARENARDAASAYDVMQIAAWMIVKQRFYETEQPIQSAIDENLRLNRFGAAAAGFEMLERGYRSVGDSVAADKAATEALQLHAASGRTEIARTMLERLASSPHFSESIDHLEKEISRAELDYENSILEVGRARDYEHLYRRLLAAGDPVQAWMFRQKANDSLAQASKRAMHRRQTGIVALLYNSNSNRNAAQQSLDRARDIFVQESREDLLEHIQSAQQMIW